MMKFEWCCHELEEREGENIKGNVKTAGGCFVLRAGDSKSVN